MGDFFEFIVSAAPGTAVLAILLLACGWYMYAYGLPAIQNQKTFEEEKAKWLQEKDELNTVIKNHVKHDSTEKLLLDLIKTCQSTHEIVSTLVVETDKEFVELSKAVERLVIALKETSAGSDSVMLRKMEGLDAEVKLITQQVVSVSSRLGNITGLLIGNQLGNQRSSIISDLLVSEVKDLK